MVAAKVTRSKNQSGEGGATSSRRYHGWEAFLLRTKFGDPKYALLDQLWSSADAYLDLAASAADATEFFKDQKDHEVEKLFWSQFNAPARPCC